MVTPRVYAHGTYSCRHRARSFGVDLERNVETCPQSGLIMSSDQRMRTVVFSRLRG